MPTLPTSPDAGREPTDDAFLGGRLSILQPRSGYRAGLDAVLLAAAVPLEEGPIAGRRGPAVLDVGAGVGVVGLAVASRHAVAEVTLLEKAPALAALAAENARRNDLADRVTVVAADVTAGRGALTDAGLAGGRFDHVVANPPFQIAGRSRPPRDALKAGAHEMAEGSLRLWIAEMVRLSRSGASITLIHRAEALGALLHGLEGPCGSLRILPIQPAAGADAIRVIVQARKASRAPARLLSGLVLHEADGGFRPAVNAILRDGAALDLSG